MRAWLCAAIVAVAIFVPAVSGGASPDALPGFRYGVAAGEITASGAVLWARAGRAGPVTAEVSLDSRFGKLALRKPIAARPGDDLTVRARVQGLQPGTTYYYRFRQGRSVSARGSFKTAPAAATPASVRFAFSGDADATSAPGSTEPFFNRFEVYDRMAAERNDFNINLGDTIYSDSEVGGTPAALTLQQKWAKYKLGLALPPLTRLRGSAGLYSQWDDHEFVNDFSREEHGEAVYKAGVDAFTDYAPVSYSAADGLYRHFRWGKNVELFFLDERSFRSAKASAGGVCNTAGRPDLAPTAPQAVRNAFAALAPPLAQPVAQACLDRINDPARTMLGSRQLARFMADIQSSTATFKVIVNEVPIQQFYALPYDRWEGYAAERRAVVDFLRTKVKNAIFLTTDTHANFVNDVRLQTLEPGGPVPSGIVEVVTGPVATNTFAKEIDSTLGSPGTGIIIGALFFKPAPPGGVGMTCIAPDVYSYGEVAVTSAQLTVTLKDAAGQPVRDVTGAPCAPVVVQAQ